MGGSVNDNPFYFLGELSRDRGKVRFRDTVKKQISSGIRPRKLSSLGSMELSKIPFAGYFQVPAVSFRGGAYLNQTLRISEQQQDNLAAHVDRVMGLQAQCAAVTFTAHLPDTNGYQERLGLKATFMGATFKTSCATRTVTGSRPKPPGVFQHSGERSHHLMV